MSESLKTKSSTSSPSTLAEDRNTGRTLGSMGMSVVAHVAFLAAIAIVPQNIRELGGGTSQPQGGEISLVDSADSAAGGQVVNSASADAPVEVSVMTDESSDISMSKTEPAKATAEVKPVADTKPEPVIETKPEPKKIEAKVLPVKKAPKATAEKPAKTAPAVAAPIVTDDASDVVANKPIAKDDEAESKFDGTSDEPATQEPAPVLLANPPSDEPKEETPAPVAVVKTETKTETKPAAPVAQSEPEVQDEKPTPVVAVAKSSEGATSGSDEANSKSSAAPPAAAAQDQSGEAGGREDGAGSNANQAGGVTSVAALGPIRDASELKALPGNPNPVYPARDRLARKQGTAVILGRVSADGRVTQVALEHSSGSAQMDAASIQAFRSWRFQAGQQGWVRKPFQFRLVGEAKEVPAPLGKGVTR